MKGDAVKFFYVKMTVFFSPTGPVMFKTIKKRIIIRKKGREISGEISLPLVRVVGFDATRLPTGT